MIQSFGRTSIRISFTICAVLCINLLLMPFEMPLIQEVNYPCWVLGSM